MKKMVSAFILSVITAAFSPGVSAQDIFEAVRVGNIERVKNLLEQNPKLVNERDSRQWTPLHIAVAGDKKEIAAYLIERGAAVDAKTGTGATPLHCLMWMTGSMDMARLLIEKGADINSSSTSGTSILMMAAIEKRREIVDYLLDIRVFVPSPKEKEGQDLFFVSVRNNLIKLFDRLISLGADIRETNLAGNNLLHEACRNGSIEMIKKLLHAGIKTTDANRSGWTPLHYAAEGGYEEAAVILMENRAPINTRTVDGYTAYDIAVELKNAQVADLLVLKGADTRGPEFPVLRGPYFGQKPPGKTAEKFAPPVFTTRYNVHGNVVFSPDGKEAYWSVQNFGKPKRGAILESKIENGKWTLPRLAFFSQEGFFDGEPFISPDGKKLYFNSARPLEKGGNPDKINIWVMGRGPDGWSEPKPLPEAINSTPGIHWQMSVDRWGNLYFDTGIPGGFGYSDIYYSKYEKGEYHQIVNLGPIINGSGSEVNPYIAPDGSYLIVSTEGAVTLFSRKKNGTWTSGTDLTSLLGMQGQSPMVSHDGKYLFFTDRLEDQYVPYWIDASFIEKLRAQISSKGEIE